MRHVRQIFARNIEQPGDVEIACGEYYFLRVKSFARRGKNEKGTILLLLGPIYVDK